MTRSARHKILFKARRSRREESYFESARADGADSRISPTNEKRCVPQKNPHARTTKATLPTHTRNLTSWFVACFVAPPWVAKLPSRLAVGADLSAPPLPSAKFCPH